MASGYIEPAAPCQGIPFWRLADSTGDGTNGENAIGDYSAATGTPTGFRVTAQPGEELLVYRIIIHIEDEGAVKADTYGALPALAVGINVRKIAADGVTVVHDLLDRDPIHSNADWGHQCYDVSFMDWGAAALKTIYARWTFRHTGTVLILYEGQSLEFYLADNFTGLEDHHFAVQGTRNAAKV